MTAKIIDGRLIAEKIKNQVKQDVAALKQKGVQVGLAVIWSAMIPPPMFMSAVKYERANKRISPVLKITYPKQQQKPMSGILLNP